MEKPSQHRPQTNQMAWRSVLLYLALAFGISWAIWMGLLLLGVPFVLRAGIGLYGPAVAAVLVRWWTHEGFTDAGLGLGLRAEAGGRSRKPGSRRLYLVAYLLIPLLLVTGLALSLVLGVQRWTPGQAVQEMQVVVEHLTQRHLHLPLGISSATAARLILVLGGLSLISVALPVLMVATFGEEFGWRGYLLPRLVPLGGPRAALLTGIIWGLWHTPVIVVDGFDYGVTYPGYPWTGVGMLVLFTTSYSVIFAWLRFRSGSVWPSTLAHAALNGQASFLVLFVVGGNPLLTAPVGLLGILPPAGVAVWLVASGSLHPA